MAQASIAYAKGIQEEYANKGRAPNPAYKEGDFVWLSLRNVHTNRPNKKLDWKQAKYRITKKVSPLVFELNVPSRIYNQFHVSLLRPTASDPFPS